MQVLVVEPLKAPYVKEINEGLISLQHEVGGPIEIACEFEYEAAILCNEEGKLEGLELNRALFDDHGEIRDIIAGSFVIVGLTEDDFGSLTPEQISKYSEMYRHPEIFLMQNGKIVMIPITEKMREQKTKNEYEELRDGILLVVERDGDPIDPRKMDETFGTLVCFDRYWTGDNHGFRNKDEFFMDRLIAHFRDEEKAVAYLDDIEQEFLCDPEKVKDDHILEELSKDHVILPVYLYRHGGDTVSTEPFSDPWDSGQIGWIYADHNTVRTHFGDVNEFTIPLAKQLLESEIATWNDYIMGENYRYDLINDKTGEIIDGGFWTGDIDSLKVFAWNTVLPINQHQKEKDGETR